MDRYTQLQIDQLEEYGQYLLGADRFNVLYSLALGRFIDAGYSEELLRGVFSGVFSFRVALLETLISSIELAQGVDQVEEITSVLLHSDLVGTEKWSKQVVWHGKYPYERLK